MRRLWLFVPLLCTPIAVLAQSGALTVSPASISLSYTIGSEKTPSSTLNVGTTGAPATQLYVNYLNLGTPRGFLAISGSFTGTPTTLTVYAGNMITSANPTSILDVYPTGTYTAMFSIGGTGAGSLGGTGVATSPTVTVTLTIMAAPGPTIKVTPASTQLVAPVCPAPGAAAIGSGHTPGEILPDAATTVSLCDEPSTSLDIASLTGTDQSFTVTANTSSVTFSPPSGVAPGAGGAFRVRGTWDPTGAPEGNSTVQIRFTTPTGSPVLVTLTLVTTHQGIVNVTPTSGLTFNLFQGGPPPNAQFLTLNGIGSVGSWALNFSSSASAQCPDGAVTFSPQSGSLASGPVHVAVAITSALTHPCFGVFLLNATGAVNSAQSIPVTVNVGPETIVAEPGSAEFVSGGSAQVLIYGAAGDSIPLTISSSPANTTAQLSSNTAPAVLSVSPSPSAATLGTGIFTGNVVLTSPGASNTLQIPVTLTANIARGSADPAALTFQYLPGTSTRQSQKVDVSLTPGNYNVATVSPFSTSLGTITAPSQGTVRFDVTFDSTGVTGNLNGAVSLISQGASVPAVTVPLTVTAAAPSLEAILPIPPFSYSDGVFESRIQQWLLENLFGRPIPNAAVSANLDGVPLPANPAVFDIPAGGTPAGVSIQIPANLTPGPHIGTFTVTAPGFQNPLATAALVAEGRTSNDGFYGPKLSELVAFYRQLTASGQSPPLPVSGLSNSSQPFVATAPNWLTVGGATLDKLTVGVNPTVAGTLPVGVYDGAVRIAASVNPYIARIPVSLVIGTAPPVSVVNAASGLIGPVSPGEIVSIFGSKIGPATAVGLTLTSNGSVSTTLGNTQVLFDGVAAPLTYAGSDQINAVAPYEIAGRLFTSMTILRDGVTTGATALGVTESNPAIFAVAGGSGQGAIANQDGTYNSASNPAPVGSAIVMYGTAEGIVKPAAATGAVTSSTGPTFPSPIGPVTVTIGGNPAQIIYAGEAPGFSSGVLQVNTIIPPGISTGSQPVVVTVGNSSNAAQGITVAVK